MAWDKNKEISMEIDDGFDFILEEGANTSINLRRIGWNGRPSKIDIRKWVYNDGAERAMKGISLSDDGTNELANVLVEQGFGNTKRIARAIMKRQDYDGMFNDVMPINNMDSSEDEEYYDPSELLGGING